MMTADQLIQAQFAVSFYYSNGWTEAVNLNASVELGYVYVLEALVFCTSD